MTAPLVSVGIPLYGSLRFLDFITRNIEAIDYANVEIIVSDRHRFDDTLERLAARFPGDKRLRFIDATDKIGWVENYNLLLQEASGQYFVWMAHDDFFPPGVIPQMVTCLEAEPDVLIAYPRTVLVELDGRPISCQPESELLLRPGEPWSVRAALRQLIFRQSLPIRGMLRREPIVNAGLYMRSPLDTILADLYWVFATGLVGRPRFVPSAQMLRRVYTASTSGQWGALRLPHVWSGYKVLCSYIRDFAPGALAAAEATAVVSAWSMARAVAASQTVPVPLRGRGLARRLLAKALSAPVRPSELP